MQQPFSVWLRVVLSWVSSLKGQELMFFLSSRAKGGDERWRAITRSRAFKVRIAAVSGGGAVSRVVPSGLSLKAVCSWAFYEGGQGEVGVLQFLKPGGLQSHCTARVLFDPVS